MSTKIRNTVSCDCKSCNGKCVEERTRKRHLELEQRLASSVSGFVPSLPGNNCDKQAHIVLEIGHDPIAEGSSSSKKKAEQEELISFDSNYDYDSDFSVFVPKKGEDMTGFGNWKSIGMMMKAIIRLAKMKIAAYLQKEMMIWF